MSSLKEKPDDREQTWRLRWFFAFVQVLLLIASIITLLITKNPYSLSLLSASILFRRFERFLFPMSLEEKEYRLKKEEYKLKIQEAKLKVLELQRAADAKPIIKSKMHISYLIAEWLRKYM